VCPDLARSETGKSKADAEKRDGKALSEVHDGGGESS